MDKNSPKIGLVSLGCPKALVDSEVLINKLQTLGYGISQTYDNADAVVVNTCGFLDTAKAESLNNSNWLSRFYSRIYTRFSSKCDEHNWASKV